MLGRVLVGVYLVLVGAQALGLSIPPIVPGVIALVAGILFIAGQ